MKESLSLVKVGLGVTLCSLSVYSFVHTSLYGVFLEAVQNRFGTFSSLTQILPLLILAIVLFWILLVAPGGGEHFANTSVIISLLLYLPSIAPYSELNWLGYLGLKPQSQIPFWETLLIGMTITAGYLLLYFLARIEDSVAQLQDRGALRENTDSLSSKKFSRSAASVTASFFLALSAVVLVKFSDSKIAEYMEGLAAPQLMGVVGVLVISIIAMLYIYSERLSFKR